MRIESVSRRRRSPVDNQGMKRAVAGIVVILSLAGPAMAAEQSPATALNSQEVAIGSALTVTATETITTIGLVATITKTPGVVNSASREGAYSQKPFIN